MEILILGDMEYACREFLDEIEKNKKIVLYGKNDKMLRHNDRNLIQFEGTENDKSLDEVFNTYNFSYVIYFSMCYGEKSGSEAAYLEHVLKLCRKRGNLKLIYLYPYEGAYTKYSELCHVMLEASEELVKKYVKEGGKAALVQTPFLIAKNGRIGITECILSRLNDEKKLEFMSEPEQKVDFLFVQDLGDFIVNFVDEDTNGLSEIKLYGDNEKTVREAGSLLMNWFMDKTIQYGECFGKIQECDEENKHCLRKKYGWTPATKLELYCEGWLDQNIQNKQKKHIKLQNKRLSYVFKIVECICLIALCEILTVITRNNTFMDFADFRLFYVMIIGTVYGIRFGVVAAIVACVMHFVSANSYGNWQIQFYNIINWLPFATYILAGSIAGYTKSRYSDIVENTRNEEKTMENKYLYLTKLYRQVLVNKEQFGSQIVSYEDSFGRMYSASKRLGSMNPREVYLNAVSVLEDMLDTESVAVYSVDDDLHYARLMVCSGCLAGKLTKSVDIRKLEACMDYIMKKETWVNRNNDKKLPAYAYGIFAENKLKAIVVLCTVSYEQMSIDYLNRFRIMCGLVSDSIMKAAKYIEVADSKRMIPGTRILKNEDFEKEYVIQKKLRTEKKADFCIMKVLSHFDSTVEEGDKLSALIRNNDIMGIGRDRNIYLLLMQSDKNGANVLRKRFMDNKLSVEMVGEIG